MILLPTQMRMQIFTLLALFSLLVPTGCASRPDNNTRASISAQLTTTHDNHQNIDRFRAWLVSSSQTIDFASVSENLQRDANFYDFFNSYIETEIDKVETMISAIHAIEGNDDHDAIATLTILLNNDGNHLVDVLLTLADPVYSAEGSNDRLIRRVAEFHQTESGRSFIDRTLADTQMLHLPARIVDEHRENSDGVVEKKFFATAIKRELIHFNADIITRYNQSDATRSALKAQLNTLKDQLNSVQTNMLNMASPFSVQKASLVQGAVIVTLFAVTFIALASYKILTIKDDVIVDPGLLEETDRRCSGADILGLRRHKNCP